MTNVKILLVSHKPFKIPDSELFIPIHAGREIAQELSKDGKISSTDFEWMISHTIGDNTGENISAKNRFYSECSALYWAWKNYDKIGNPDYIGLMHYRRHFIFNEEYFESKPKNKWENALGYINENFIDDEYIKNIGLNDANIYKACENCDMVVSKDSNLQLIHGRIIREDYENTIPGAKIEDFDLMLDTIKTKYPEYTDVIDKNITGYKKTMYQMFIMKKELFFEYCEFLFNILFEIEKELNFDEYSMNGKRTLGYLAEDLQTIFVWKKQEENIKIQKLGVTMVEYPYDTNDIKAIIEKGCPSYLRYLSLKLKSIMSKGNDKQIYKEQYQSLRRQIQSYKKLKKLL